MTVHDWIVVNFSAYSDPGHTVKVPTNCSAPKLIDYAKERFGWHLREHPKGFLYRYCPHCGR